MKMAFIKIGLLVLAISTGIACGKNKKNDSTPVSGSGVANRTVGPSNLPVGQSQMAGTQSAVVVGTGMTQAQYDETIKVFLSTNHQPQSIGTVNPQNGVQIIGKVAVNNTNGAAMGNSGVRLIIADSETVAGRAEPFVVTINTVQGGASNGSIQLEFRDEYGSITVNGTYDASQIRAKVTFANTTGGYNGRKDGTLGDFVIPTCAFLVCQ